MADWFYAQNGQQYGPVTEDNLKALLRQGTVQPTDLVWTDGMGNWLEARTVPALASAAVQQVSAQPAQAPIGYYNQQATVRSGGAPPPNYLVQSILVTLCCCLPFGIVAIVMSAQVNGKYQQGDYAGAVAKSEAAKKWCWAGFICGLIIGIINIGIRIAAESR